MDTVQTLALYFLKINIKTIYICGTHKSEKKKEILYVHFVSFFFFVLSIVCRASIGQSQNDECIIFASDPLFKMLPFTLFVALVSPV